MEEKESYLLITRYLSQQTTTEESGRLADWIAASAANEQLFYQIKAVWQAAEPAAHQEKVSGALKQLKNRIAAAEATVAVQPLRRVKWYAAAASLVAALLISGIGYSYYTKNHTASFMQQVTLAGQKKTFKLEDGTLVHLAPQSSLQYPAVMEAGQRTVILKGEAYFEVTKNPHRPFIVHTTALDVQVLGTHFNVKSYKSTNLTTVSLLEGKVKVTLSEEEGRDEYLLRPGQEISFNHLNHRVYQHEFDVISATGWMTNTLVFKNDRLADAAEKMEKIYGIRIVFADAATADTRLYASFENESLINVLETIKAAGNVAYSISGNKVYLTLNQ